MILTYALIVVALVLLFGGAELLVKGSASLAARAGLTPLVIGLTVVAFGTSSPELAVSLKAAFAGQGDVAVGNVVGSNILNIAVILGLSAVICPIRVHLQLIKVDVPIMILATVLLPVLLFDGRLGRVEGGMLFAGIVVYSIFNVMMARKGAAAEVESEFAESVPKATKHWSVDLALIGGGLVTLVVGSRLLVDNSIEVARAFQISEAVIGLTVVALGTSMPELATSIIAALRRQPDIALGNAIGSNIFNILGTLGLSTMVVPMTAGGITLIDYGVMVGTSVLLLPFLMTGPRLGRLEGLVFLGGYCGYLAFLWPR
ncbi:calcium/sodium antiporter [Desulfoprunum benzoelyticum]|jgi:cation:H+ antiporter|uniref:Cation:H+ antiporter n=1 Tax=Desulfoprunum benzoelyticum TaxID=1506996 RepID=A0A840UWA0_9BACT|nr:calcium/sodium antiporter [Desulfoprunum benzoelyticum]MBB5349163.1 cation:H+ antiporter [Desulfoprunum benzoelyticum]MBM9530600.1 calcium/sodium antiporter [Desulfoprunum benzoelyticum]